MLASDRFAASGDCVAWRPVGLGRAARACLAWIIEGPRQVSSEVTFRSWPTKTKPRFQSMESRKVRHQVTSFQIYPSDSVSPHSEKSLYSFDAQIVVNPGETTLLQATLLDDDPPSMVHVVVGVVGRDRTCRWRNYCHCDEPRLWWEHPSV